MNHDEIKLTGKAAAKALEFKVNEGITDSEFLRICVKGNGCAGFSYGMYFDGKAANDKEFEFNGLKVCIDPFSYQYLEGVTIDYVESPEESGFKFTNVNTGCGGCGHSFTPK